MDANRILYDYIVDKYGDVASLSDIGNISPAALNAVLLKDNVSEEIRIGLNLCGILNIDVEKMVFDARIVDYYNGKSAFISDGSHEAVRCEIYDRCMRLSEIEKREVLKYMERISSEKNGGDSQEYPPSLR